MTFDGTYTLGSITEYTMKLLKVGTGERPDLALTGFPLIDNATGGLFPGTLVVIGATQGTGKSYIVLDAMMKAPTRIGIIFLEDGPDMVGARALAYESGINSRDLRFAHKLKPNQVTALEEAVVELDCRENVSLKFLLGGSIEEIEHAIDELGEDDCEVIVLDYLHKVRGVNDNRRTAIDDIMVRYQKRCDSVGAVPVMMCQLSRQNPTDKNPNPEFDEPAVTRLKESGSLETEARVIVMLWPESDGSGVNARLAKSSFGGEGARDFYYRESCGSLKSRQDCSEWSEG